jgi:signal transduction histidine kinase
MQKLEFVIDVDPSCPDILLGDSFRLREILINLAINGIKVMYHISEIEDKVYK